MSMILDVGEIRTLKEIIAESGLTHQQLADIIGVKQPRISEMIKPGQDLRMSTSIKLAKALNVSLKTLAASIGQDTTGIPDDSGGEDNN
jgi:plasmid maintenance system antidote protein VapI